MICHPVLILFRYRPNRNEAWTWIRNDLASHLFLLFIFPFALGIFLRNAHLRAVTQKLVTPGDPIAWALLGAIELLVAWFVYVDVANSDRFIPPHQLADDSTCMRATSFHSSKLKEIGEYEGTDARTIEERSIKVTTAQEGYRDITRVLFDTNKNLIPGNASITLYSEILFTLISVWFAFLYFWYVGVLLWAQHLGGYTPPADQVDDMVLVCCLLLFFFPARLYTEWYLGFFSLKVFRTYPGFWLLLLLAAFALVLLLFVVKAGLTVAALAGIEAVFVAAAGFVGWWKPEWLRAVGRWFANAQTQWIVALGVLTLLFLLGVTAATQHPPQPPQSELSKPKPR